MPQYFVFSISDQITKDKSIDKMKRNNLEGILTSVLGPDGDGKAGERRRYEVNSEIEEHPIVALRSEILGQTPSQALLDDYCQGLAERLSQAELVKNGTRRHKLITQGILIIKISTDRMTLLKLEMIDSIDKTTYARSESFSTDKNYFKACIIDRNAIHVVDQRRRAANYWVIKFLGLVPFLDDTVLTGDLIELLREDRLLSKHIDNKRHDIQNRIKTIILKQGCFSAEMIFERLHDELEESELPDSSEDLFDGGAVEKLGTFRIDGKNYRKFLKKKIDITDEISLDVLDFARHVRANVIDLEVNRVVITISGNHLENIRDMMDRMKS